MLCSSWGRKESDTTELMASETHSVKKHNFCNNIEDHSIIFLEKGPLISLIKT